ncbi:bifunctional serine/threonine-protein kinase/ABC transporter substrate-binding protein [Microcoleus sp. LAD1_D5]|uniref:bifunctional serine/threonine-protein kinase/ABC transporter substrate-binding protein n=1 Tax=unclassified Microcoleus TaxID=2642155 RepID=UPI002FD7617A
MCLYPGDILRARYQIIALLGEGGFARTYTANDQDQPNNSPCVVKEIRHPQSTVPEVLQRANAQFEIEAEALHRLGQQHPRIPNLIDSFEENGKFYLILEYIYGQSLSEELTTGTRWTEKQVIVLLQEILSVIEFVHGQGMVHRDIHPGNLIKRSCDGSIVLIDFGAVREISTLGVTHSGEITTTQAIGIRGYMPAEQLLMPWNPQPYNDIYAIGAIAVQALTHVHPNNLPRDPQSCELLWHYSTPDRELPQISDSLRGVLNRMVRFPYCDRYHSAADVLQDLRSVTALHSPSPVQLPSVELGSDTNIGNSYLACATTNNQTVPQPSCLSEELCSTTDNQTVSQAFGLFSQKLRVRLSAIALVAAGGVIAIYYSLFSSKTRLVFGDGLSAGEEILFTSSSPRFKQKGVDEFAYSKSQSAFNLFKESWNKEDGKDPETLIYMNNAFLEARNVSSYTIAVALPIRRRNPDSSAMLADQAKEVLRGVAQAQTEVNLGLVDFSSKDFPGQGFLQGKAINRKGLKVVIADDANSKSEAEERAKSLVKQPDILAVIGHNNSDMTMHAVDIYNRNNLVLMSPGTSTEELTEYPRKYFFRTPYTSKLMAKNLAEYLSEKSQKKAVVLYNPASPFGAYFRQEFTKDFQDSRRGTIAKIRDFDLSKKDFNAQRAIKEIEAKGETAIALVPDAQVTNSLNNAVEIMKLNRDRNWIVGAWTLMRPQTLELASQQHHFKKLVFSVGWHPLNSPNKKFPQSTRSLWGGEVNTRTALAYDAARALIKALEMQPKPSREGMQKTISEPNFRAYGATGTIQFESPNNGDRKNPPSDLVHIVECPKEQFGLAFVPVKYPTAAAAGLKCD